MRPESLTDPAPFPRALKRSAEDDGGVYLVELALVIPIFLGFILFFLWLAIHIHLSINFTTAVNNAVQLGASRGDASSMGYTSQSPQYGLIPALHRHPFWSPEVEALLCHGVTAESCRAFYDAWSRPLFGKPFDELQKEGHYAIAYAEEAMRIGGGEGSVRFPCDASGDVNSGDDGAGCLDCRILPPEVFGAVPEGKKRLALECRYQPDSTLFGTIMNMLSRSSGAHHHYILTRQMFFDRAIFTQ